MVGSVNSRVNTPDNNAPDRESPASPCVTVLMAVHNGEQFLREAMDSILSQTFEDFEFLVFEDCSTDSSPEILESYTDSRLQLIRNPENLGLTRSLQLGLERARGRYIARMDADDVSVPDRLEKQVQFLRDNPEIALVGSWIDCIDADGRCFSQSRLPTEPEDIHRQLLRKNCMSHPTVMFLREAAINVGGYQSRVGLYAQDYDLWLRLSDLYRLANIPEPLVRYRFHGAQVTTKKLRAQTDSAEIYRWMAADRRLARGEPVEPGLQRPSSWISRARRKRRVLAKHAINLAALYLSMNDPAQARNAALTALRSNPLSIAIWETAMLDVFLVERLSAKTKSAIRWYLSRLTGRAGGKQADSTEP